MTWKPSDESANVAERLRLVVKKTAHEGVRSRKGPCYGVTDNDVIERLLALDDLCQRLIHSQKSNRRTNAALREFYTSRLDKLIGAPRTVQAE